MRLSREQITAIRDVVCQEAGPEARVRVFGSRLDDERRGGDLDLFVEVNRPVANPAWLAARISGRLTRSMHGRDVDVVLSAPNLQRSAVHAVAEREGRLL
ncbi:MAG TPA: nucleotidyltransferase domain-containing protein [Nitrococcus sp.]|nr:nucleotidyltransferase domain-containing protein [Nitrococcus sp.]